MLERHILILDDLPSNLCRCEQQASSPCRRIMLAAHPDLAAAPRNQISASSSLQRSIHDHHDLGPPFVGAVPLNVTVRRILVRVRVLYVGRIWSITAKMGRNGFMGAFQGLDAFGKVSLSASTMTVGS